MPFTVVSQRAISLQPARCHDYEFEDLFVELTGARLLAPAARTEPRRRWRLPRLADGGASGESLTEEQDLLFVNCMTVWDLDCLASIRDWRARSRYAVCWIKELFKTTEISPSLLRTLSEFDRIILNFEGSVTWLADQLPGIEVHHVPLGIDALRFNPFPSPPDLSIDINWVGRTDPEIHSRILQWATAENKHFVFNTAFADQVADYREHRDLFCATVKRSRLFVAYPAKFNDPATTGGQQEIGYRYLEGASAGARLIGRAPDVSGYVHMFPAADFVVDLPEDSAEMGRVLGQLLHDESGESSRRRSVAHCLRHHDWSYRIGALLRDLGLDAPDVTGAIAARRELLLEQAAIAEASDVRLDRDAS